MSSAEISRCRGRDLSRLSRSSCDSRKTAHLQYGITPRARHEQQAGRDKSPSLSWHFQGILFLLISVTDLIRKDASLVTLRNCIVNVGIHLDYLFQRIMLLDGGARGLTIALCQGRIT